MKIPDHILPQLPKGLSYEDDFFSNIESWGFFPTIEGRFENPNSKIALLRTNEKYIFLYQGGMFAPIDVQNNLQASLMFYMALGADKYNHLLQDLQFDLDKFLKNLPKWVKSVSGGSGTQEEPVITTRIVADGRKMSSIEIHNMNQDLKGNSRIDFVVEYQ